MPKTDIDTLIHTHTSATHTHNTHPNISFNKDLTITSVLIIHTLNF